jgi:hypothetical protein
VWSLSLFESRRMLTVLGLMKTREKLLRGRSEVILVSYGLIH